MITTTELQALASLAARRAGEHVLANLHRRGDVHSILRADVKHKLDVEAQENATAVILAAFPNHAILGEETCDAPLPESDYVWIIDPIDGTINFFHGLPWWCCSVAVRHQGKAIAGAVFLPEMHQLYEATCDGPALCNGVPIHVSNTDRLDLAMLATGADKWDLGEHAFKFMRRVAEIAQRPRILGAAAVDMCMVAAGRLDGYFESGIYVWDMAAASLIVERAGGCCEILKSYPKHRISFLATNGHLHAGCREALLPLL
ncbi:MAG TPA: inositol monophosphatase family protein [Kiritimatiellia bacterium]|nr:inositol monophosphatase family protein [Kiritimatiellia bacterium]